MLARFSSERSFRCSSIECLDIHLGAPQSANLGDGNGFVNQTIEIRQDFGDAGLGTCLESLIGGNHLRSFSFYFLFFGLVVGHLLIVFCRMFRQNGSLADTGALFLAFVQSS